MTLVCIEKLDITSKGYEENAGKIEFTKYHENLEGDYHTEN